MLWEAASSYGGAEMVGRLAEVLEAPFGPSREEWGRSPEAVAGHRAMMALAGGAGPTAEQMEMLRRAKEARK